jgi:hypothetical protein
MKTHALLSGVAVLMLMTTAPAAAHHAFAAEFDANKPLTLKGVVTEWEMINPHSWIHIDVAGPDGKVVNWMVEGGSPNVLLRLGFSRTSLPPGTVIVIEGFKSKDGSNRAVGAKLTFEDGRRLFLGSNAPGANSDSTETGK